jgi:WD40 repeat protein
MTLASGSPDKTVRLWDVATLKQRSVLEGHTWTLCYSPDGTKLASTGWGRVKYPEINERMIKIWDTQTGENVGILNEPTDAAYGSFTCLTYSPDGTTLALAGDAPLIRLWDVASGQIISHLRQDLFHIHCVAYCPDGRRLVSAA